MPVIEDHRKRVAAERREKMRARLLESALQIIAADGLAALSIDRLIAHAEVSRGTFYKYYDAPQALVRELALDISNELIAHADPLVQQIADPAARISFGLRSLMHTCRAHPVLGHFLIHLGWHDIHQQHLVFDYVKRDIEQGFQQGRFKGMGTDLALCLVGVSAIAGLQVMMGQTGTAADVPEDTAAAILRALGTPAQEAHAIARLPMPQTPPPETRLISKVMGRDASG
jgi:TetR/AcrR family transcriptional regulator, ethionamide resistance regulator